MMSKLGAFLDVPFYNIAFDLWSDALTHHYITRVRFFPTGRFTCSVRAVEHTSWPFGHPRIVSFFSDKLSPCPSFLPFL